MIAPKPVTRDDLEGRVVELHRLDWGHHEDLYGFPLDLIEPGWRDR